MVAMTQTTAFPVLGLEKTSTCWLAQFLLYSRIRLAGYLSFQERQGMLKHAHTSHWECASPFYDVLFCAGSSWIQEPLSTQPFTSSPILFTKKEQASRKVQLTLLPLSQVFMYLLTEKVSSREQPCSYYKDRVRRGKIAREDLE